MRLHQGIQGLRSLASRSAMSIGNFDGVHRGHASLIEQARAMRESGRAGSVAVVTFEPHPLTVLQPDRAPARLTTGAQKRELLAAMGVDDYVELAPTRDVLDMPAEEFWRILRDEVQPVVLVEGEAFNFGKDRGGNIETLREWSVGTNVKLHLADPIKVALTDMLVVDISSTLVRWLVARGRARDVAICLGRPFELAGTVVKGFQRGRTIGVPTANLQCDDPSQLIPGEGVYAGNAFVNGTKYPAAISIGRIPTFTENVRLIEAHLIDVHDLDLYGQPMRLQFTDWIREQRKYSSIDTLKEQLAIDVATANDRASIDPSIAFATATV